MTTPVQDRTIPFTYQGTIHLSDNGQQAALVLGATGMGSSTFMTETDAFNWMHGAWAQLRKCATADVVNTGFTVRSLTTNPIVWELPPSGTPGGSAGATRTVSAACTLIKWSTAHGGRSGKGRTFVPGLGANFVAAGGRTYGPTYNGDVVAPAIAGYLGLALWAGNGLKPAVVSFRNGAAYPITSGSLAGTIGMQRRRMR